MLRWAKRGLGLTMVLTGAIALVSHWTLIVSDNAIVSTHRIMLRTPIAGLVVSLAAGVGRDMPAGTHLATVFNDYADDRALLAARIEAGRVLHERDAARAEVAALTASLAELERRGARHIAAIRDRLAAEGVRAARARDAKLAEAADLRREADRKIRLAGVVSAADVDHSVAASTIAVLQADSLDAEHAIAMVALDAARDGLEIDPNGANDVPYSLQRADEVRLRVLDIQRQIATYEARLGELDAEVASETATRARLGTADIVAPADTRLWQIDTAVGERVGAGAPMLDLIDCRASVLLVSIPQARLPDIDQDGAVTYRLAGERVRRQGRIRAMVASGAVLGDATLAAAPAPERVATVTLVVAPDAPPVQGQACVVGRTARVVFAPRHHRWLAALSERLGTADLRLP